MIGHVEVVCLFISLFAYLFVCKAHLCKHSIHKVPRQCLNLFVFEIIIGLSRATDRYFDKLRYFLQDYKHVFVRTLLHRRYLISIGDDVFLCCIFFYF